MCGCVVVGGGGARGGSLLGRAPGAYQEPPGAAKAERTRHEVSLGGPRRTLVRRSCPTEEGPTPRAASCRGTAAGGFGVLYSHSVAFSYAGPPAPVG